MKRWRCIRLWGALFSFSWSLPQFLIQKWREFPSNFTTNVPSVEWVYCTPVSRMNPNWKVPSVLDCTIDIDGSFSGFPLHKIPRLWWRRGQLNQQFKKTLFLLWLAMKGNSDSSCTSICVTGWARIYISVNRVFTHVFEWPCKGSNPRFTMNKCINNEISSALPLTLTENETKPKKGVWLEFHSNSMTDKRLLPHEALAPFVVLY